MYQWQIKVFGGFSFSETRIFPQLQVPLKDISYCTLAIEG